jgi:ArsR family transcriptional regulator, lead/cadmium/zinc/bismuth-responsive transcriptional repressor
MKDKKDLYEAVDFLRVISDKCRLHILYLLKKKEMCVCEIWQSLNSPQNLTSHHLKVLKDFGLISSRKDGLKVFYKLNSKTLEKHQKSLSKFI